MKKLIFNWLFKKEIEDLYQLRQKTIRNRKSNPMERVGFIDGIDTCLQKLGAINVAWKYTE